MADDAADLTTQLISARHSPAEVRAVLEVHMATHPPLDYTRDVSVAACGLVRVLHMLSAAYPEVDTTLDTTVAQSHYTQEHP